MNQLRNAPLPIGYVSRALDKQPSEGEVPVPVNMYRTLAPQRSTADGFTLFSSHVCPEERPITATGVERIYREQSAHQF